MSDFPAGMTLGEFDGLPSWLIATRLADAAVSVHGGQLLSWRPHGHGDVLWRSPDSQRPPRPLRGGVPVCWPYFGRQGQPGDVPQHGHARTADWVLAKAEREGDGAISLDLVLPPAPATPLLLRQRIRIGTALEQALVTHNPGAAPLRFTQALHSYFAVGDAMQATLSGLAGRAYADKLDGARHVQLGDWSLDDPRDPGRCDRLYADTGSRFELVDPVAGRRILLNTEGSRSLVVWNPGEAGSAAIADLPAQGWRGFVCVEAANAGEDEVELAPGHSHWLVQRLSVSAL